MADEPETGKKTEPVKEPAETPEAKAEPDKTFSQADIDRVVEERLARERKKYEGYDDLKAKAAKLEEIELANASDLEKAQKKAEKATQERDEAVQRAQQTLVRAAVIAEAAKQGAVDTDAVVALLPKDGVTVGDDGQVTGAEDAVKALLESKPFLVGDARQPSPGDGGARTPVPPKGLDEQIREAEQSGDVRLSLSLKNQKLLALREREGARQ